MGFLFPHSTIQMKYDVKDYIEGYNTYEKDPKPRTKKKRSKFRFKTSKIPIRKIQSGTYNLAKTIFPIEQIKRQQAQDFRKGQIQKYIKQQITKNRLLTQKKFRDTPIPQPLDRPILPPNPNYALETDRQMREELLRRRMFQRKFDLMKAHKDQMIKVDMDFISEQGNILQAPNMMKQNENSISVLRQRAYNVLTPHPRTTLRFGRPYQDEREHRY